MESTKFIETLEEINQTQREFITALKEKPKQQLSQKPNSITWSILEVVDHMNKATELYLDQIETKIDKLKLLNKTRFKKTWLAAKFTKSLAPTAEGEIKNKMNTMNVITPTGQISIAVLDQFIKNTERIDHILGSSRNKDLRSFKVTTALGPILRFYLGDALDFILAHNERHVVQIGNLL